MDKGQIKPWELEDGTEIDKNLLANKIILNLFVSNKVHTALFFTSYEKRKTEL